MPKVCSIGRQSAAIDGKSGGRALAAFKPASVSWMPRRRNQPSTQRLMLAMNGTRQPQEATCSGRNSVFTSHADPDPSMKPMVTPEAVELLTSPRISGEADSVV